jgi:hypothetical protein
MSPRLETCRTGGQGQNLESAVLAVSGGRSIIKAVRFLDKDQSGRVPSSVLYTVGRTAFLRKKITSVGKLFVRTLPSRRGGVECPASTYGETYVLCCTRSEVWVLETDIKASVLKQQ